MEVISGPTGWQESTVSTCPLRHETLSLGVGARATNMVLEACPFFFLYKGLWCLRCSDVR